MRATTPQPKSDAKAPDPVPANLSPMLATLASRLPADDENWAYEYKWDGVRALAYIDTAEVRLTSRNRLDITHRYPEVVMGLAAALKEIPGGRRAILDGEIVALDAKGQPSFELLQRRMNVADRAAVIRRSATVPVVYMLFDVLYLGSRLLLEEPYQVRREALVSLPVSNKHVQIPPACVGGGKAVLEAARKVGLEGVVAKRLTSLYRPGARSGDWLKIKLVQRQEFVIGGWLPIRGGNEDLGALLLGYFDGGRFRYAGKVGTGFTNTERSRLRKLLQQHARSDSPFVQPTGQRDARYVDPAIVAEVEYREWTDGGSLRHPSYKGLRTDKEASGVVREQPR